MRIRQYLLATVTASCLYGIQAQAAFIADFPSAGSTAVASVGNLGTGFGYFWSAAGGDMIQQTFTGTGLAAVGELDLSFPITDNYLSPGAEVDWSVLLNGVQVGGWVWKDTDGVGQLTKSYTFAPIQGLGTYNLAMEVINEVPSGEGSIAVGFGTMTVAAVPEPSTVIAGLGALGMLGLLGYRKRR